MSMTEPDYQRRFGGIARLYGNAGLERLRRAHVCVIGVGGVGSWTVEALARSAVGRLTLIDLDHVAESNTNRQLPALDGNYGKAKVQVLAERVQAINPGCAVNSIEDFVTLDNIETLIHAEMDWVTDCIDSFRVKAALLAHCRRQDIDCITVGGAGGQTDPTKIQVTDLARTEHDPLLAKIRKQLRREHGFSRNPKQQFGIPAVFSSEAIRPPAPTGSCASDAPRPASGLNCAGYGAAMHVTACFGLAAAGHVLGQLAGRQTTESV